MSMDFRLLDSARSFLSSRFCGPGLGFLGFSLDFSLFGDRFLTLLRSKEERFLLRDRRSPGDLLELLGMGLLLKPPPLLFLLRLRLIRLSRLLRLLKLRLLRRRGLRLLLLLRALRDLLRLLLDLLRLLLRL